MLQRSRIALFLVGLSLITFAAGGPAFGLQLIPDGIDVVVAINNHSSLPLQDLISNNPMVPAQGKEIFQNFVKAVSFNPVTDISSIQLMVQIGNKAGVVVATGKFDTEKLLAQLKLVGEKNLDSSKINELPAIVTKDGKAALCFPDATTVVAGTPDLVKAYLAAAADKKANAAYTPLLAKASDKAYFTILAAGDTLGKAILAAIEAKAQKRQLPPAKEALRAWCHKFFLGDITGKSLFAQQLDDKFELWLTYDHAAAKDCTYHFLSETTDPNYRIDNAFREFLKALATVPAPAAGDKAEPAKDAAPDASGDKESTDKGSDED